MCQPVIAQGRALRRVGGDKFGLRLSHPWLWRLKDRIDRRFMAMFAAYPQMAQPALPSPAAAGLAKLRMSKPWASSAESMKLPKGSHLYHTPPSPLRLA